MIIKFLSYLKKVLTGKTIEEQLEAYIIKGNPQTSADVEMLEREFYRERTRSLGYFLES